MLAEIAALMGSIVKAKRDYRRDDHIDGSSEKLIEFRLCCDELLSKRDLLLSHASRAATPCSHSAEEHHASSLSSIGQQPPRDISADIAKTQRLVAPKTGHQGKSKSKKRAAPIALRKNSRGKYDMT